MAEDERQDTPQDETTPEPAPEQPPEAEREVAPEQPAAESAEQEPEAEQQPEAEEAPTAEPETAAEAEPAAEQPPRPRPKRDRGKGDDEEPEAIPGAHLEPDLVLEEEVRERDELAAYAEYGAPEDEAEAGEEEAAEAPSDEAAPLSAVLDLAADARYRATGKRKTAVARVTLKPGTGRYTVNGKDIDEYFPRMTLQTEVRQPLETVAQQDRMDIVATIHGGGVSAQAGALRHGITRALVEADPNLRGELKRRGFLTRDQRGKERKKAGLKKARKRPQFSKR